MKRGFYLCVVALGLAGCVSPPPPAPGVLTPPAPGGSIVRVNSRDGYVVAECSLLPSPGEEATVFVGDQPVGRLRFTGRSRMPYAVADLVEGRAQTGDRWRVVPPERAPDVEAERQP